MLKTIVPLREKRAGACGSLKDQNLENVASREFVLVLSIWLPKKSEREC